MRNMCVCDLVFADLFIANSCPHIPKFLTFLSFVYVNITWFGHMTEYIKSTALTHPHNPT